MIKGYLLLKTTKNYYLIAIIDIQKEFTNKTNLLTKKLDKIFIIT